MNLLRIRNTSLRLFVLLVIGVPAFSNWPVSLLTSTDPFHKLAGLLAYLLVMILFIWISFGIEKLTDWVLAAAVISVTVVLPQILLSQAFERIGILSRGHEKKAESIVR